MPGRVYGTPGGSLTNAGWAANAEVALIGQRGEQKTAVVLDRVASLPGGPTVLHDLMIPGYRANIDHVVVSGNVITLLDSKVWRPGFYWTFGGITRRGLTRFAPADRKTMALAAKQVGSYLSERGISYGLATPLVVVWPSTSGKSSSFGLMHNSGATVVPATVFQRKTKSLIGRKPANPHIVNALVTLLAR